MLSVATITASSAGGRFVADKPTLTHTSAGQFTIGNYSSLYTYSLSSGSRSGAIVTPSGASSPVSITAASPKSVSQSTASTCEWRTITSYSNPIYGYGQIGWNYPWCNEPPGVCPSGNPCAHWPNGDPFCQIAAFGNGAVVGYSTGDNPPPAGFSVAFSQWGSAT